MRLSRQNNIFNSLFFKLFAIFTIFLPLIAMFIYNNYQTRDTLLSQVRMTHDNMLQSYWIQIDNQLKNAVTYSIKMALFESDPQLAALSKNESEAVIAKFRISQNLKEQIPLNNFTDTLFVYVNNDFIAASQTSLEMNERNSLKTYIQHIAEEKMDYSLLNNNSNWKIVSLNNQSSLVHIIQGDNGIYAGIYINVNRLLSHFNAAEPSSALLCLPTSEIAALISNPPEDKLVITSSSSIAPIAFAELIPEQSILKSLPFMQKYTLAISIFLILLVPYLIALLQLTVVQPLQKLIRAMRQIGSGSLNYRIAPYKTSNEITIVNNTFNQMMDTVQNLKINIYEEEIKTQKSQLRNLQLQIRPHFLINSLNMVYNLVENGDSSTAKRLIVHSVDYFRYLMKVDEDLVPLYDEMKHVTTYLKIQMIRYKDKFTYSLEIDPLIADMLVPPMLIQNFVENSIKYAIQMNNHIQIAVRVSSFERDYYPYAKISISDSGHGYPQYQLWLLNQGERISKHDDMHIGIYNAVKRLKILFKGQAEWHFYNDHGAVSELILPALFAEDNTEDLINLSSEN
ncbi:Sensor histidine kinase YpdA [compost metagenome]